jgi:hypothetical protein
MARDDDMREASAFERFLMQVACSLLAVGTFLVAHELTGLSEALSVVVALAPLAVVSNRVGV